MSNITLTASMRSNLLSLQSTQDLMDTTQERLSTGKKVNSAIDSPSSFYTAQSLNNRASDLSSLLDSMGQGIQTIKAANEGIEAITTFVQQAKAIANSALDSASKVAESTGTFKAATATDNKGSLKISISGSDAPIADLEIDNTNGNTIDNLVSAIQDALDSATIKGVSTADKFVVENDNGKIKISSVDGTEASISGTAAGLSFNNTIGNATRAANAEQFNGIMEQIDQLAKDSGYKGINLLQKNDLTVVFNEDRSSKIDIKGVDASSTGLKIARVNAEGWMDDANLNETIVSTDAAISQLRTMASEFGNNYSVVQNREDFTENLINVLTEGADKLTLADMNEESANMLALQTRQQLAINSLSLASQAAQSVLSLF
ncbi:MAG: flagellar protein [Alphaproteobacteria bacterium]|nr:flagellar protein [Alphaproteobacteria bacterium]